MLIAIYDNTGFGVISPVIFHGLGIFILPEYCQFQYALEPKIVYATQDCATMNDACLLGSVRNPVNEDTAGTHFVSYGNALFLVLPPGCGDCLLPIEFQRFLESYP